MASISAGSFSSCQIQQYVRNTSWKIQQKLEEKIRIWKYNKKYECGAKVTILCIVLQISPPYFWLVSFIFMTSLHCCFEEKLTSSKIEISTLIFRNILCCLHIMVLNIWVEVGIGKRCLKSSFFENYKD